MKKLSLSLLLSLFLTACVSIPSKVEPVTGFKLEKYLGQWFEIARLDHSFERGLSQVSATYSLREDGGVRVINKGYLAEKQKWKQAEGKAYFVNNADQAYLKVSFFGPFYGSYVVMDLDKENYQYALVCGPNTSYLWILSRQPKMSSAVKERLIAKAAALGFDTQKLIFVQQN